MPKFWIVATLILGMSQGILASPLEDKAYDRAVAKWMAGSKSQAILEISELVDANPDISPKIKVTLVDYLLNQKRFKEALEVSIDETKAPAYLLEGQIVALKETKASSQTVNDAYAAAISRFPERAPLLTSYIYWMADSKRISSDDENIVEGLSEGSKIAGVWEAVGYFYKKQGNSTKALLAYSKANDIDPNNKNAILARVSLLRELKSPAQASRLNDAYLGEDSSVSFQVRKDEIAQPISWSSGYEKPRQIPKNKEAFLKLEALKSKATNQSQLDGITADQIIALEQTNQCSSAISMYERGVNEGSLPGYVQKSAIRCYQELKKYDEARRLLLPMVEKDPSVENLSSLFYLESAVRNYSEATRVVSLLTRQLGSKNITPDDIQNIRLIQAKNLAYNNKLEESEAILNKLEDQAPGSTDIQEFKAVVHSWKNEPINSSGYYKKLAATTKDETYRKEMILGYAGSIGRRGDKTGAASLIKEVSPNTESQAKIKKTMLESYAKYRLELTALGGYGKNQAISDKDLSVKGKISSKPIAGYNLRAFSESQLAYAALRDSNLNRARSAVGIEYSGLDYSATAAANYVPESDGMRPTVTLSHAVSDNLKVRGAIDASGDDIPGRALKKRITGISYKLGASVKDGKSSYDVQASSTKLSDSNLRGELSGSASYQVLTSARTNVSIGVGASYSKNSVIPADYYNPATVKAGWVSGSLERIHTVGDNGERLSSEISVSTGIMDEYSTHRGKTLGATYKIRKALSNDLEIAIGATYVKRPYDGTAVARYLADFELYWNF